jgi:F420H(2)-dependent quinone reductase
MVAGVPAGLSSGYDSRLWPRLDAANREYATYRAKTTREIPIVVLEPR